MRHSRTAVQECLIVGASGSPGTDADEESAGAETIVRGGVERRAVVLEIGTRPGVLDGPSLDVPEGARPGALRPALPPHVRTTQIGRRLDGPVEPNHSGRARGEADGAVRVVPPVGAPVLRVLLARGARPPGGARHRADEVGRKVELDAHRTAEVAVGRIAEPTVGEHDGAVVRARHDHRRGGLRPVGRESAVPALRRIAAELHAVQSERRPRAWHGSGGPRRGGRGGDDRDGPGRSSHNGPAGKESLPVRRARAFLHPDSPLVGVDTDTVPGAASLAAVGRENVQRMSSPLPNLGAVTWSDVNRSENDITPPGVVARSVSLPPCKRGAARRADDARQGEPEDGDGRAGGRTVRRLRVDAAWSDRSGSGRRHGAASSVRNRKGLVSVR
ncbi:hypothetical protein ABE10_31550, partial [Bacillus toyonensis]|nr:hypothetical protein [Bacillus toyonensis]